MARHWHALAALLPLLAAHAAAAQVGPGFEIRDRGTVFFLNQVPGNDRATALDDFFVGGFGLPDDQIESTWWWYRIGNATRESSVNAANPQWTLNAAKTSASADFALADNVVGRMRWAVTELRNDAGLLESHLRVTNNTNAPIDVALFHYLDLDLSATPNDDAALLAAADRMTLRDNVTAATYRAFVAGADYRVRAANELQLQLTNDAVTVFDNSGLPFGPGNFTGGWEWGFTIPAGQSDEAIVQIAVVNRRVPPAAVPEPRGVLLTATGLLALWAASRRRAADAGPRWPPGGPRATLHR